MVRNLEKRLKNSLTMRFVFYGNSVAFIFTEREPTKIDCEAGCFLLRAVTATLRCCRTDVLKLALPIKTGIV
jgi:hypothetical protein